MANHTSAPKQITWIICLVLFLIAVVAHFGIVRMDPAVGTWSWIIGYALLLVAVQVRDL